MHDYHPFGPASDQNLLFGVLALQADFIDRDSLIDAMSVWEKDRTRSLGEILTQQGNLSVEREILIEAMVEERLRPLEENRSTEEVSGALSGSSEPGTDPDSDPRAFTGTPAVPSTAPTNDRRGTSIRRKARGSESRYRVLRPHAKGGFGEVFVAEDLELPRRVALKEIQSEYVGDMNFRTRFVQEAEITGGLEHPGIVPIYGLGAYPDGRPYYAMRFVNGVSLTESIDHFHRADVPGRDSAERSVAFRQLLRRFVDVCNAVGYAHSRGVIHRDLKPANVMLGQYGETLIVDWGLAKTGVTDARAEQGADGECEEEIGPRLKTAGSLLETQPGAAIGTPAYMSPEQAAGQLDLLGPATDIYGLGAILYTVLTGQPAFRSVNRSELLQAVQHGGFSRPRQVKADVPSALDAICLKAMALQPTDRYASALDLAGDVEHWLADEPTSAYREKWPERSRRFLRRHRTWVTSIAAMLVVALVLSIVGAVLLNVARENERQARFDEAKQKDAAKVAQDRAEAVAKFLVDAFRSPDPSRDGREIKVVELLDRAVEKVDKEFGNDPAMRARLLDTLGSTYLGLGLPSRAVEILKPALQLQRITLGDHDDTRMTMRNLAAAHRAAGDYASTFDLNRELVELLRTSLGPDHPETLSSTAHLAQSYLDMGRIQEAREVFELVRRMDKSKLTETSRETLTTLSNLAVAYWQAGQKSEAIQLMEQNLEIQKRVLGADHPDTLLSMSNLGMAYREDPKRAADAIPLWEETLRLRKVKLGSEHPDTLYSMNLLGLAYHDAGRVADALPIFEEALRLARQHLGRDHRQTHVLMNNLAGAYRDTKGSLDDALALMEESLELTKTKRGVDHQDTIIATHNLAMLYMNRGKPAKALPLFEDAVARFRRVLPDSPNLAALLAGTGECLGKQAEFVRAEATLREALDILEKRDRTNWLRHSVEVKLGEALLGQGNHAEAETMLLDGYKGLEPHAKSRPPAFVHLVDAVDSLVRLYEARESPDKAAEWRAKRPQTTPKKSQ